MGGLGESVFLTGAGWSQGGRRLGGREKSAFLFDAGRSQGKCSKTEAARSLVACMLELRVRLEPRGNTEVGTRATNSP